MKNSTAFITDMMYAHMCVISMPYANLSLSDQSNQLYRAHDQ